MRALIYLLIACSWSCTVFAQASAVWSPDNGDGTYTNPVIHADYSDPDVVRVGEDFYMISSSFNHAPGLPILHSRDLVNWKLIGHALPQQIPVDHFRKVQHGNGVWAPSIRYHRNEFYIYYPDPDFGIYLIKSKSINGPWSAPILVEGGKGLIDPCPLWDDDGKAYLVHALAGSRAGIKSILIIKEMNAGGTKTIGSGVMVYDGHDTDPTIEGPKIHKRNGWYYLFAPAGGVATGWQLVLRSKKIYGPYERRVVMDQGMTNINGPHQGAWINTSKGEDWFLHFQDKGAYGRIVHLQPMKWISDWPVIGNDSNNDGKGEPVGVWKKPAISRTSAKVNPPDTDEFDTHELGLQWQWQANPSPYWWFQQQGRLRLFSAPRPDSVNFWHVPNLLMQKFPAERFTVTTALRFNPRMAGEEAGLIVFGLDYARIAIRQQHGSFTLRYIECKAADKGSAEKETILATLAGAAVTLRVNVSTGGICTFSYSEDGIHFTAIPFTFTAREGKWVGAKVGLYCTRLGQTNDAGFVDAEWFRLSR